MRTDDDLCLTPATEPAAAIRRREVSPVDVTTAALARIERLQPTLNCFVTVVPARRPSPSPRPSCSPRSWPWSSTTSTR
ncbi:hypothetical protein [Streptomyces sp. YKOK-I1]